MKKVVITALFSLTAYTGFAVPIVVSNQSPTNTYPQTVYNVETFLGILKDGGTCSDTRTVFYNLPAGMSITMIDGTTIWNNPWNGTTSCISELLGSATCDAIPLDHDGQRMAVNFTNGYTLPAGSYVNGIYATTQNTFSCHPNMEATTITSFSYEKILYDPVLATNVLKISYMRFGNALATINYE